MLVRPDVPGDQVGSCHAGCVTTQREPWPSAADPLGEALHFLQLRGAFYCRSEFTAPFGLELPPLEGYLWFHVISRPARPPAGWKGRCVGYWQEISEERRVGDGGGAADGRGRR